MSARLARLAELELPAHLVPGAPAGGGQFHLADGLVLSIGPQKSRLLDLAQDGEVKLDFRHIEPLEKLALGWEMSGLEAVAERLQSAGIIEPGPAGVDAFVRRELDALDRTFVDSYFGALDERARFARERLLDAHARRKRFFEQVGQCPVLPETALRRALSVGDAERVGRKRVLCLGDDDLVSVALAALGHEVTVFDIDEYLLTFLRRGAEQMGLAIETAEVDLRDPLPADRRSRFDVVLTDPMSNRDCFELFFSRAAALLAAGGRLLTAVNAATGALFAEVCAAMGLRIDAWHARHNRYYTHYLKLHTYESDWVELSTSEATRPKYGPDEFCVPLSLYREDMHLRLPLFVGFYDELEEVRFARPFFLDMLFDVLAAEAGLDLSRREVHTTEAWTLVHVPTSDGHLSLHVDRARRQLTVELYPFVPAVEDVLRHLLMAAYKTRAKGALLRTTSAAWELRVR